jgi:hypothetical protein
MPLPPPKQRTAYGTYLYFTESDTLDTFLLDNAGFSWTIFKKYESKAALNIGLAIRNTIPGIGTGKPGSTPSDCVERGDLMVLPQGTSFLSTWDGIYNASVRLYMMRVSCEGRPLKGNSGLILTAGGRAGGLRSELQNRFQGRCEMEFGILG